MVFIVRALLSILVVAALILAGGQLPIPNPSTVWNVASFPGATTGDKIVACVAALPSTGGTCDARSLPSGGVIPSIQLATSGAIILGPCGAVDVQGTIHIHNPGAIPGGAGAPLSTVQWYGCGTSFSNNGTQFHWVGNAIDPMFSWQGTRETISGNYTIQVDNSFPLAEGIRIETDPGAVSTNHVWRDILMTNRGGNNNLNFGMRWCTFPDCGYTTRFNGSISGTTLTVNSISYGAMHVGQFIRSITGSAITTNTFITAQTSGPAGGPGQYTVSISQTIATEEMAAAQGTAFTGTISNGSGGAGTQLVISSLILNTPFTGQQIFGVGVSGGTFITAPPAQSGVGTYTVNNSQMVGPIVMSSPPGVIGNNDLDTLYNVFVTSYGTCAFSLEGSQVKTVSFFNSTFSGDLVNSQSGVCTNHGANGAGSFRWIGGGGGGDLVSDFSLGAPDDYILIQGINSENSNRLLTTSVAGGSTWAVDIIGGRFDANMSNADGKIVIYQLRGPLNIIGLNVDIGPTPSTFEIDSTGRPEIGTAIGNRVATTAAAAGYSPFKCTAVNQGCWNTIGNILTDGGATNFTVPNNLITFPQLMFGALPACELGATGASYFITDQATAPAWQGTVSGGGSNKQWVYCDGTVYRQQ